MLHGAVPDQYQACPAGRLSRQPCYFDGAICTKISLGLTMPNSLRAFSSTISRPSLRSRTSAASWSLPACALIFLASCSSSRRCMSRTLGMLPRPIQSCAWKAPSSAIRMTRTKRFPKIVSSGYVISAQVVKRRTAWVGGDLTQIFFYAQQLVVFGHAVGA